MSDHEVHESTSHFCIKCGQILIPKSDLVEILARAESMETAKEVRHLIKEYYLD